MVQLGQTAQCASEWAHALRRSIVAEKMGHHQFKASNGWLGSFKKCHNIRQFIISGEAADVSNETVEGWHERLKSIMAGYKTEDV